MMSEWERCAPWIEAALPYAGNTHTIEDVRHHVETGRALLLAGQRSAMVLEVIYYPQCNALRVWLAGGDLNELKLAAAPGGQLEQLALHRACDRIRIEGRRGWVRALGWDELCTTIERTI